MQQHTIQDTFSVISEDVNILLGNNVSLAATAKSTVHTSCYFKIMYSLWCKLFFLLSMGCDCCSKDDISLCERR